MKAQKPELRLRSWEDLKAIEAARLPSVIRIEFSKTGDVLLDLGEALTNLGKRFNSPRLAIAGQLFRSMTETGHKTEKE